MVYQLWCVCVCVCVCVYVFVFVCVRLRVCMAPTFGLQLPCFHYCSALPPGCFLCASAVVCSAVLAHIPVIFVSPLTIID